MTDTKALFPVADNAIAVDDQASALMALGDANRPLGTNYLKFTKRGEWVFGREDDELTDDELVAVNPASFTIGWQGWHDGRPVNGPVVPVSLAEQLPEEHELDAIPPGDMNGWNKLLGVSMQLVDDGTPLQYNTSSYGGKKAVAELARVVGLGLQAHPDAPVALVRLKSSDYKHAQYGKIYTPEIELVHWADANGVIDQSVDV